MKQHNSKSTVSTQTAEELLKYKNLFDDGLISQSEFETKKAQILGLENKTQTEIAKHDKNKIIKVERKTVKRAANVAKRKKRLKLLIIICAPCLAIIIGLAVFLGLWFTNHISHFEYTLNDDGNSYSIFYAGSQYSNKREITIPSQHNDKPVTTISNFAFMDCTNLESIIIPDSVTSIGQWAFRGCTNLKSITIPNSVKSIDKQAFCGCISLESLVVSSGNTIYRSDGNCIIKKSDKILVAGCKNSIIPSDGSVTDIGDYAFMDCTSLTSIAIPDTIISIGDSAFSGCSSLESVTIGNGVTSIGRYAFHYCTSLESITIPDSVTEIGYSAYGYSFSHSFSYCTNLKNVIFGNNIKLKIISANTFSGCTSLESITIPDSVISIDSNTFNGCTSLESIAFGNNSKLTFIDERAFQGCTSLTSISIPDSVTSIGNYTFKNCTSLTSVIIGNSVTSIDPMAFDDCASLKSVIFKNASRWVVYANEYATIGTNISESDLNTPATAAVYLTKTYCSYYWKRK